LVGWTQTVGFQPSDGFGTYAFVTDCVDGA
jgi:hypothetical protein